MSIHTEGITVHYGNTPILNDVGFTARPGEINAIVGPNGSGKTTFLKALTGEIPYQGSVMFNGSDIRDISPTRLATMRAVLPQSINVSFPFTVLEVVQMGLMAGVHAGRKDLPEYSLQKVGLSGFGPRFYQELSGGEKQRVQLARILLQVWEPVVDDTSCWLFLDEPVSSLDIAHQLEVMAIARAFADAGGGVIAVMHDLNLTAAFSDKIALFEKGRLYKQGSVEEVLTSPHLSYAYNCTINVSATPDKTIPFILPQTATLNS